MNISKYNLLTILYLYSNKEVSAFFPMGHASVMDQTHRTLKRDCMNFPHKVPCGDFLKDIDSDLNWRGYSLYDTDCEQDTDDCGSHAYNVAADTGNII